MSSRKEQKEQARQERIAAEQAAAAAAARGRRMKIIGAVIGGAAIVVAAAVIISLGGGSIKKVGGAAEVEARFKGIPQQGLTLGRPDAPVTIVEFADLKCPVCKEFTLGALPTIISDYVKTGKVRMQVQLQSFLDSRTPGTPDSTNAAKMALAVAQQNKFWNFIDLSYINQKDETTVFMTESWLKKLAASVNGLDGTKAYAARNAPQIDKQLTAASNEFNNRGFQGTPSFLIGKTGGPMTELTYTTVGDPGDYTTAIDGLLK